MTNFSLYQRMREHGTLAERSSDVPDARFALPSTINWMRALAILVVDTGLNFHAASLFYKNVPRRTVSEQEANTVFEQLLFALHQLSGLEAMSACSNKADVARTGIVAWYYGVYGAASAMVAASDGSFPRTHAATAARWDRQLAETGLVMPPFADRISNLVEKHANAELETIRARGRHSLTRKPESIEEAWGGYAEYLSGTVAWEQWNIRELLKNHKDFKALGVTDFRRKEAQVLRDQWYNRRSICFLHQASRYRGKANYRDAIYLAYGRTVAEQVEGYVDDLVRVLRAFVSMAGAYAGKRLGRGLWQEFVDDLEAKRSISVSPHAVWSCN